MNKYVQTKENMYINIKYLLEVNRKAYRYVVQNFFTRIQPKVLNGERFVHVQSLIKLPSFLRKQLVDDFDKKGDKLSFENDKVVLKVKDKKIMEYDPSNKKDEPVEEPEEPKQEALNEEPVEEPEYEMLNEEVVEEPNDELVEETEEVSDEDIEIPEYDESMLKKELIKIAEDNDVEIESNDTKSDIISKLDEKFGK
jgi:hypothetical protein